MKHILCYGDSNTWGYNPEPHGPGEHRFSWAERWPGRVQDILGGEYRIIEEGLGGRTTAFDDVVSPGRNGLDWIVPCIHTHQPLDLVIFMLGTNDTKPVFHANPAEIGRGMEELVRRTLDPFNLDDGRVPKVLIISPILVGENLPEIGVFDASSTRLSRQLAAIYRQIAENYNCGFLNAAEYVQPSPDDEVHLDRSGHSALADAVAAKIKEMLG